MENSCSRVAGGGGVVTQHALQAVYVAEVFRVQNVLSSEVTLDEPDGSEEILVEVVPFWQEVMIVHSGAGRITSRRGRLSTLQIGEGGRTSEGFGVVNVVPNVASHLLKCMSKTLNSVAISESIF